MSNSLAKLMKQQFSQTTLTGDQPLALLIWYTGSARGEFKWNATKFSFEEDDSLDTSVNTGGTADGEITDAEAATLGAVIDLINADTDGNWHARIIDGFRDSDTTDLLEVTESIVTENGITAGGGSKNGCVCWDVSDLSDDPFLKGFGVEHDDSIPANARISASNLFEHRDVLDADFALGRHAMLTSARINGFWINAGNGAASVPTLSVYSASQGTASAAAATKIFEIPLTDDTTLDKLEDFVAAGGLVAKPGERIVVQLTSANAIDNLTYEATGSYGDPG